MTLSTSPVAVWYSSDSCSSRVRVCSASKACVFDGNHRLIGEVLQHRDLAVAEGTHLGSIESDRADDAAVLQQRNAEQRPSLAQLGRGNRKRITRKVTLAAQDVRQLARAAGALDASEIRFRTCDYRRLVPEASIGLG